LKVEVSKRSSCILFWEFCDFVDRNLEIVDAWPVDEASPGTCLRTNAFGGEKCCVEVMLAIARVVGDA
jgi:hypothetical protein